MTKTILKSVVWGAIIGASLFFMPKFIIGMFIFFAICGLFMGRRMHGGRFVRHHLAYADKIRTMSEEEYAGYKNNIATHNYYCHCTAKTETSK